MVLDYVTSEELMAALPEVLSAPTSLAQIDHLCLRPDFNQREFPQSLTLGRETGIVGDRWLTAPWLKLPNGNPDPRIQVSILSTRVLDLVWKDRHRQPHPGDSIIADIETSEANLPAGTLLQAGTAVLRVSDVFNDGCVKWRTRYGQAAKDWITAAGHPELRLRGILCSIERDGIVTLRDRLTKL